MPKDLMPANDTAEGMLERMRSKFLGAQPFNPINGPPSPQEIMKGLVGPQGMDIPSMARHLSFGQLPNPLNYIQTNDRGPGFSGQMPPGHEAAMQEREMAAQMQRATDMAAQARRSQLQLLTNPNLANTPAQAPMEQQQGPKISPIDLLKSLDPNKFLE